MPTTPGCPCGVTEETLQLVGRQAHEQQHREDAGLAAWLSYREAPDESPPWSDADLFEHVGPDDDWKATPAALAEFEAQRAAGQAGADAIAPLIEAILDGSTHVDRVSADLADAADIYWPAGASS